MEKTDGRVSSFERSQHPIDLLCLRDSQDKSREFNIETHEVARSEKVIELGLASGHMWRALTREGACPYRHFEYHEIWKQELGVSTHELASSEL
jgi:hypothetical protein